MSQSKTAALPNWQGEREVRRVSPIVLLRRVRDYAEVRADGLISSDVANRALDMLNVDIHGFDMMDRKLLLAIIQKFDGGPVGVDSLAAAISEERGTIEDVLEPYLIQQGFMMRTSRGRTVTRKSWSHFGLTPPVDPASGIGFVRKRSVNRRNVSLFTP